MAIKQISIDIESYSDVDLKKCSVYKYAEFPNFEILLFAYSLDNGPVQVIDLAQGEEIPESILATLSDDRVEKWAYNASFERICLSEYLRKHHPEHFKSYSTPGDTVSHYLDPSAWKCSRIWGAYMGLPLSLEGIGAVLKLPFNHSVFSTLPISGSFSSVDMFPTRQKKKTNSSTSKYYH